MEIATGRNAEPLDVKGIEQPLYVHQANSIRGDGVHLGSTGERHESPGKYRNLDHILSGWWAGSETQDRTYLLPKKYIKQVFRESFVTDAGNVFSLRYYAVVDAKVWSIWRPAASGLAIGDRSGRLTGPKASPHDSPKLLIEKSSPARMLVRQPRCVRAKVRKAADHRLGTSVRARDFCCASL